MEITNLSPIEEWLADFEKEPLSALDNLLRGRAYMGKLNRNETSEILFRLFHTKDAEIQRALDKAMRDWFQKYWMAMPPSASSAQWAEILQEAFISVQRLHLRETYQWLSSAYFRGRSWLRSLYQGPARDPEAALLQTLALCQQERTLLPLWIRLCRMEEDLPLHYGAIGLLGLRRMPEEDGTPPGGLKPIVFKGIVDLAEAIDNHCKPHEKKQGEHLWLLECRAIMALYPRTAQYWIDNFSPVIHQKPISEAAKWFNKTIPGLFDKMERQRHDKKPAGGFLSQPSMPEREKILRLLEEQPLDSIKEELQGFLEKHRRYAYQTGVSEFLVKTFCNIGNKILKQDNNLALALVEEAFFWEPYNPFTWTVRAKMEELRGNNTRSIALLWEAKRRFPGDAHIRTSLANSLGKKGEHNIAAMILRQASIDFPKNDVCRNGLAEVLKALGRLEEAVKVYCQASIDFPKDGFCRTGLAEVLKALGRLEEAEQVYRQASIDFPKDGVCRTGLAGVLLQRGKRDEAIALLEETIKKFPRDKVAKEFLQKVKEGELLPDMSEVYKDESARNAFEVERVESGDMPRESAQVLSKIKFDLTVKTGRKVSVLETTGDEKRPPVEDEEVDVVEEKIGMTNLYRLASRMVDLEEKRAGYKEKAFSLINEALQQTPDNIPALLENGWLLLDEAADNAGDFFAEQLKRHPHALGLHVGSLRYKDKKAIPIDNHEWAALSKDFSANSTVINLEHTLHEMAHGNGSRIKALDGLRKQLDRDTNQLPASLRDAETWAVSLVKQSLFSNINLGETLTEDNLQPITDNYQKHELMLKGIVEQCVSAI